MRLKINIFAAILGAFILASLFYLNPVQAAFVVSQGGTATTSFNGGVVFTPGGTSFLNSSSSLYWDNTNGRLGIGTSSPTQILTIVAADTNTSITSASIPTIRLSNSNTTNFNTEDFVFGTFDANNAPVVATKFATVNTSHVAGAVSADQVFLTRNLGTLAERMRLTSGGSLLFNALTSASGTVLQSTGASTSPVWVATSSLGFASGGPTGTGANGFSTRWTSNTALGTGVILDSGISAGINATTSTSTLYVKGTAGLYTLVLASSTGRDMFVFNGANRFGIGTSTPAALVDIYAIATGTTPDLFNISSATTTRLLTVTAQGDVGIGSTTPAALLSIQGPTASAGAGINGVDVIAGTGSSGQSGGNIRIQAGTGGSTGGVGGITTILGGTGGSNTGGAINIKGGSGNASGTGGLATFGGGDSPSSNGGNTRITSGIPGSSGITGSILIQPADPGSGGVSGNTLTIQGAGTGAVSGNFSGGLLQIIGGIASAGNGTQGGAIVIRGGLGGNSSGTGGQGGHVSVFGGPGIAGSSAGGGGNLYLYGGAPSSGTTLFGNVLMAVSTSSVQSGNVGVGSTTPTSRLSINALAGIATSTRALTVASSSSALLFEINGAGHIKTGSGGGTATTSSCGTGPVIVENGSTGEVTTGSGVISACTVTFAIPHVSTPKIFIQEVTATATSETITARSNTGFTITFGGTFASSVFDYLVID